MSEEALLRTQLAKLRGERAYLLQRIETLTKRVWALEHPNTTLVPPTRYHAGLMIGRAEGIE